MDLYTGEPVDFDEIVGDLAQSDLVFLGEHHTVPRHHRRQLEIIEALTARRAFPVLGVEMLQKKFQPELDRYARGEIDFQQLAELTDWGTVWSNYEDYRDILESARKAGLTILALNGDLDLIRKIGRQGLDALTDEEANELPKDLQLKDQPYFDLLEMQMMVHAGVTEENLRNIFSAQVARDEIMAETLARYLKSPAGKSRQAIILCGSGHCAYGLGTVSRLKSRLSGARDRIVILSESDDVELSPEMAKYARDIEVSHQQLRDVIQRPLGDYLCIIQPKNALAKPGETREERP
jgi:uncharacterized iron-regulated protein